MTHLGEAGQRLAADALGGRVGRDQFGMRCLQLLELAEESVVVGVGDLGAVEDVVAVLVMADQCPQLLDPSAAVTDSPPATGPLLNSIPSTSASSGIV